MNKKELKKYLRKEWIGSGSALHGIFKGEKYLEGTVHTIGFIGDGKSRAETKAHFIQELDKKFKLGMFDKQEQNE